MRFIYTKTFAVFAACLVVVSLLVIMQAKGWLDPVTRAFLQAPRPVAAVARGVARPVKSFFSGIYGLRQIARDNTELRRQVMDLQRLAADLDLEKRENEALRRELGFVAASKFTLIPCTVLSKNPFGLSDSLVLNCGTAAGIQEGQAVLSQGFLVGKIVYAGKNNSTALLSVSSKFSTDGQLSKTGREGLIAGSFGSGLLLDRLSQNDEVEKGWFVVTAGISQQIPGGILVGQVGDVISSENDLFKKVTLLTPIDFNDLNFVFVAKP